jgi:hypothetical protein
MALLYFLPFSTRSNVAKTTPGLLTITSSNVAKTTSGPSTIMSTLEDLQKQTEFFQALGPKALGFSFFPRFSFLSPTTRDNSADHQFSRRSSNQRRLLSKQSLLIVDSSSSMNLPTINITSDPESDNAYHFLRESDRQLLDLAASSVFPIPITCMNTSRLAISEG